MSEHDVGPPHDEFADLFAAEREAPGMPDSAHVRLAARLAPALAATAAAELAAHAAATARRARWLWTLASFVAGGAAGAGLYAALRRPPTPVIVERTRIVRETVLAPAPVVEPRAIVVVLTDAGGVLTTDVRDIASSAISARTVARGTADTVRTVRVDAGASLAGEQALLEMARSALTRSRGPEALEALGRMRRDFPSGRLVEERDSLRVQALAVAGRTNDARDAAAEFLSRHPNSIYRPLVENTVQSLH